MAIIAVCGMLFLGESASWLRLASLALVLVGVVGLKLSAS
jgi:multidrug transporter EmrE-like cation transporter